jgi:hypothetical protein
MIYIIRLDEKNTKAEQQTGTITRKEGEGLPAVSLKGPPRNNSGGAA